MNTCIVCVFDEVRHQVAAVAPHIDGAVRITRDDVSLLSMHHARYVFGTEVALSKTGGVGQNIGTIAACDIILLVTVLYNTIQYVFSRPVCLLSK